MSMKVRNSAARAACDAIHADFETGTAGAKHLRIYGGARPASVTTAIGAQPLLVDFPLPAPLFPASVTVAGGAQATAVDVPEAVGVANGTATWGRLFDKDNNACADADVGDLNSAMEIKMANTVITTGVAAKITIWTGTHPE